MRGVGFVIIEMLAPPSGKRPWLTSLVWALMHVQYDWFVISQIFLLGIFLGWLRWATGSTVLTIILHFIANLTAFVETVIKVEWLS